MSFPAFLLSFLPCSIYIYPSEDSTSLPLSFPDQYQNPHPSVHLKPLRTCLPYTLGSVMLALAWLLLLVRYQPPLCAEAQSSLVAAATASSPTRAIWTHSPPLHRVLRCSALGAYLHARPLTINFFPSSAVFWAVNQGLLLHSAKCFRKQGELGTPQTEMRSCCILLS